MPKLKPERARRLREILESAQEKFDLSSEIQNDAIAPALKFTDRRDQELAAFLCAAIAYGRVTHIKQSTQRALLPLGEKPVEFLRGASAAEIRFATATWSHRFNKGQDLALLLWWLKTVYTQFDSLEQFLFSKAPAFESAAELLEELIRRLGQLDCGPFGEKGKPPPPGSSFWFLLPKPSGGSACKRLNLFLRWMVGRSPFDLGLWSRFDKQKLIIPVDTHVLRQARRLGLTRRKQADWKAAEEITESLSCLDSKDPTRFDFALCHLGIRGKALTSKALR